MDQPVKVAAVVVVAEAAARTESQVVRLVGRGPLAEVAAAGAAARMERQAVLLVDRRLLRKAEAEIARIGQVTSFAQV